MGGQRWFGLIVGWLIVLGLAFGPRDVAPIAARPSVNHTVEIRNFAFSPAVLNINVGDTVTWVNFDGQGHNSVSDTNIWTTNVVNGNVNGVTSPPPVTFNQAGTFGYYCAPHGFTGSIVVNGSAPSLGPVKFLDTPVRAVDTRFGTGFNQNGQPISAAPLANGQTAYYKFAGQTFSGVPVPTDTTGVLINVTIVQSPSAGTGGFVVAYPGDATQPNAATVNPLDPVPGNLALAVAQNFTAVALAPSGSAAPTRQSRPGGVSGTTPGPRSTASGRAPTVNDGSIAVTSFGASRDIVIDLVGYFSPSNPATIGALKFITPTRVLDTRPGFVTGAQSNGQPVVAGEITPNVINRYLLANQTFAGVQFPSDVRGILAHITTVQTSGSGGFTTLVPGNAQTPIGTATLNPVNPISFNSWASGIPQGVGAGIDGAFGVFSTNSQHVIVDVVGYYAQSNPNTLGNLTFVNPLRVLETRGAPVGPIGFNENGVAISAGQVPDAANATQGVTRRYKLSGMTFPGAGSALPSDLKGALMNVTIVQDQPSGGYLTVFPGDASAPTAATVNPSTKIAGSWWASGIPNTGAFSGTLGVFSVGYPRDVIIDLVGYFR